MPYHLNQFNVIKPMKNNILIIASSPENYSTTRIKEEAERRGHEVTVLEPSDFYIHTSNVNGHDKIYVKEGRIFKSQVDVIIPRIGTGMEFGSSVIRHWTVNIGVPSTASAEGLLNASDKWKSIQLLSKRRVRVPLTTVMKKPEDFGKLVETVGGLPTVAKTLTGSQGNGVFILETPLAGSTTLKSFSHQNIMVLLQQYINTSNDDDRKNDIRVWVVDGKVVGAYRRFSVDGDFRSNYSISKDGETVELTAEEKQMAIDSAAAVGLGCAGVDIMRDVEDNNKPYVIEINGNASLKGIETITGENIASKIVDYAERIARKSGSNNKTKQNSKIVESASFMPKDKTICELTRRAMRKKK
jgi:ribosomal protein S6--L-glutamate ligase